MPATTETDRTLRVAWRVADAPPLGQPHCRATVLPQTVVALWHDGTLSSVTVSGRLKHAQYAGWDNRVEVPMSLRFRHTWPGWLRDLVTTERGD